MQPLTSAPQGGPGDSAPTCSGPTGSGCWGRVERSPPAAWDMGPRAAGDTAPPRPPSPERPHPDPAPSRDSRRRGLPTQKQAVHVKDEVGDGPRWGRGRGRRHGAGDSAAVGGGEEARAPAAPPTHRARALSQKTAPRTRSLPQWLCAQARLHRRRARALLAASSRSPAAVPRTRIPFRPPARARPAALRMRAHGLSLLQW